MSGSIVRVNSVGYYDKQARKAAKEAAALAKGSKEALDQMFAKAENAEVAEAVIRAQVEIDGETPSAAIAYYDNNDDAPGVWWSSTHLTAHDYAKGNFVRHGTTVTPREIILLAEQGKNPVTGEQLVQIQKKGKRKNKAGEEIAVEKRTVAHDLKFDLPKDCSSMWAAGEVAWTLNGDAEGKRTADAMTRALERASNRILRYIHENGLMITRFGKGSKQSIGALEWAAAKYMHHTSRSGDPHLHMHCVIANTCVRPDGTSGTMDNYEVIRRMGEMTALFRAEVADELRKSLGYEFEKVDRNCEIRGFARDQAEKWSKRRATILKEMAKLGYDGTANNREASTHVNRATREDKSEQPPIAELKKRWKLEMDGLGHSFTSLTEGIHDAADNFRRERQEAWDEKRKLAAENGIELPTECPRYDKEEVKAQAFAALTQFNSTFEERTLRREIFEHLQTHCSADEAIAVLDEIKAANELVQVGEINNQAVYSTPEIIEEERTMLAALMSMKDNADPIDKAIIDKWIARGREVAEGKFAALSPEQAAAVYHLLGPDQAAALIGRAGSGKSFTLGTVADILRDAEYDVHGMAPSWKATGVLAEDTKLAQEYARAITGWINAYERGEIVLSKKSVLMVDEAGMVGRAQMARLTAIAKETGARFIKAGDDRQLQPVAAGAPFKAYVNICGAATLSTIVRQKLEWQRKASMAFSTGDVAFAIGEYIKYGNVKMLDGDEVLPALVSDYMADIAEKPEASRLILTTTNADASRINNAVREARLERGELSGDEVIVPVVTRGKSGRVVDLSFMAGDRVILGETLTLSGEKYINNSTGTILEVRQGNANEATFIIKWDDGRVLEASASELIGYREEKAKDAHAIKLAHAYAMTVHSSQGMTVDKTFVYNAKGFPLESVYVAMTRHRWDAKMYVDKTRMEDELRVREGVKIAVTKGAGKTKQQDDEGEAEVTKDMVREKLIAECSKSQAKLNVCDFQADAREWIAGNNSAQPQHQEGTTMAQDQNNQTKTAGSTIAGRENAATKAQDMRERMASRKATNERRNASENAGRVTANEIDAFCKADLRDFIIAEGATYTEDDKQGRNAKLGTEFTLRYKGGGQVVVTQTDKGGWIFMNRDGSAKGTIVDYYKWRNGAGHGEALHKLRAFFGTDAGKALSSTSYKPVVKLTFRQELDRALAVVFDPDRFADIRKKWNTSKAIVKGAYSKYLTSRKIDEDTQLRYADHFRFESRFTDNPNGIQIAMRDVDGNLTGIIRKGDVSSVAAKSEPRCTMMGDTTNPTIIYQAETIFDSLSKWQIDGKPNGELHMATAGSMSWEARADIFAVAQKFPDAKWVFVGQNDSVSKANEEIFMKIMAEANPNAKIEISRPPEQFKDWNDAARGIEKAEVKPKSIIMTEPFPKPLPKPTQTPIAVTEDEAEAIAKREEARQRRKAAWEGQKTEGQEDGPTPQHQPKGPSMG